MAVGKHTFISIFGESFEYGDEHVQLSDIAIPIIQRDYAQGRLTPEVSRVRNRFLAELRKAFESKPIALDFVYGDIDDGGVLTPLDGQQRLTTLFLLHWYAAKKEYVQGDQYQFLKRFTYKTRYSARMFCQSLVDFNPSFSYDSISCEIEDQEWFPLGWKKDPTVASMLVMLDDIEKTFDGLSGMWETLESGAISFYFLPIKDMGLTDELFIKMNSRGKPLTTFEHFKAELERNLRTLARTEPTEQERNTATLLANRIVAKIDGSWMDLLWQYRGDKGIVDDEFLNYFRFACEIICYKSGGTPLGKSDDPFDLLDSYFSPAADGALENALLLEEYFDCWVSERAIGGPPAFFSEFAAHTHEPGKIQVDRYIDVFGRCVKSNSSIRGGGTRPFPLRRMILLYAATTYLTSENIEEPLFRRRLRIVNNLIRNSSDEISNSESRIGGNRMPAILRQVDSIIKEGKLIDGIGPNFNVEQIIEEKAKDAWLIDHQGDAETLYALEDHPLLTGQIGIVGLDHLDLFTRFSSLFGCNHDLVDKALCATGPYMQREGKTWRYQSGSSKLQSAWVKLFHRSRNSGFEDTKSTLVKLLQSAENFTDDFLEQLASVFVDRCESEGVYPLAYYYIKYDVFRPGRYGKLRWADNANKPYELSVLWTEQQISENAYQPFLKAADPSHVVRDDCGNSLLRDGFTVSCRNDSFVFSDAETNEVMELLPVPQNNEGIDLEDRIVLLKDYLAPMDD